MTATTSQSLGSLLKSARDIMRKDKGLNGDLDRLPLLTWIMFLKFLDDLELQREEEAVLAGKKFKPAIEKPYRWRDWASRADGVTGDELISFINSEETTRPDGTKGAGLFRYLRGLTSSNGDDRREVIATVFKGVDNRMKSGYLLRDVINKIAGIHFTSSDELHTLGALYESMLREMRDAAGDSGEFYTPRAVVRMMVAVTDPRLGETVLDPASGTGGFLVEAFSHLAKQVKTVADRKQLQERSVQGCEPKALPYLLCQMNLLLHGLDAPQIDPGNALRNKLTDIGEKERVDVILTNPPFGGEEEKGIQGNFPDDKQTAETTLLFLQLIMRKLRRKGGKSRAAVVVPDGALFGDGVCARIKEELLKEFNLHTIVRLPIGVFAPYAPIPTNLVFFDRSGPTREVWYYEHALPEGRKSYTKTKPLQWDEFAPLLDWWSKRAENERAWKVSATELLSGGCNLDQKNPRSSDALKHRPPRQLLANVISKERDALRLMEEIQCEMEMLDNEQHHRTDADTAAAKSDNVTWKPMSELAPLAWRQVTIDPHEAYTEFGVRSFYKGIFLRRKIAGSAFSWQDIYRLREGDIVFSNIMAWEKAIAVAGHEHNGWVGNRRMLICEPRQDLVLPSYLHHYFMTQEGFAKVLKASPGTAARNKTLKADALMEIQVPVPPLSLQCAFDSLRKKIEQLRTVLTSHSVELSGLMPSLVHRIFNL